MNTQNVFTGITAAILACTGAAVFVIDTAISAGFSQIELVSWMFSIYLLGGIASLFLTVVYKIPIIGAHSLATIVFLSTSAMNYSLPELAGSYLIAGLIIVIIGLTGLFDRLIKLLPTAIIDAMMAGILANYIVKVIPAIKDLPIVGMMTVVGFLISQIIFKKVPRFLGALLFGSVALFILHRPIEMDGVSFVIPQVVAPEFSIVGVISLSIPIAFLILSNETAVAMTALKKNGYSPPVSRTVVTSGIATSIAGFFGGHAAGPGGMTTALCSSPEAGPKKERYWAAIIASLLIALFGLFAWFTIPFIQILPGSFLTIIAGFSLLGILGNSLYSTFGNQNYYFSSIFTFIVALSGITVFQISPAVCALIVGILTSRILKEGGENSLEEKKVEEGKQQKEGA
ncbi:benzoate membrane transport protein [Bacillus oleivorans]|uniref:Benzoate membrane transport protein n=1 Tax=Bacillus oleivorans TaxID=1448271 RepID=A0A285CHP2_9BACI|nr:benzoate/H(+) symporter BenE family transporter [Bacillus oleivorans]SNX67111.1 benzoate membrane transport protein [Bacillus oleivorans]